MSNCPRNTVPMAYATNSPEYHSPPPLPGYMTFFSISSRFYDAQFRSTEWKWK